MTVMFSDYLEDDEFETECEICGRVTSCSFRHDPFAGDVHDDYEPMWICDACRLDREWEI